DLVASNRVDVDMLISHRFPIEEAEQAYQLISGNGATPYLGVVLKYDPDIEVKRRVTLAPETSRKAERTVSVGVIGAGGYVPAMLLPNFKAAGAEFRSIA